MAPRVIERLTDGSLPANTMPGLYPLVYHLADGAIICADCANGKNGSLASTDEGTETQWRIVGQSVFWEGSEECCEHCNGPIQSAYGEVDKSGEDVYDASEMDHSAEQKQFDMFYGPTDNYLNS